MDLTKIEFAAREKHFLDHLCPTWKQLGSQHRFFVPEKLRDHAELRGIDAIVYEDNNPPTTGVVVTAAKMDYRRASDRCCPVIYTAHGNGQSFSGEHKGYVGGPGLNDVVLFCAVNQYGADLWREGYPDTEIEIIGCPRLDRWSNRDKPLGDPPTVAISFHWDAKGRGNVVPETWSAWPNFRQEIERLSAESQEFELIGHAHPRIAGKLSEWYESLGIEWVPDFEDVLARADVYVNDCSSTLYEAATIMPVVVMNIPEYRRSKNHGMRFWELSDVGVNCDDPGDLISCIWAAIDESAEQRERRRQVSDIVFPYRGQAAVRAAEVIVQRCRELT